MDEIKFNKHGGILAQKEDEIKRQKDADLITLPLKITGTNCFNCKFIRDKKSHVGYCAHHKVAQNVNARMCCIFWTNELELRQFHGRRKDL